MSSLSTLHNELRVRTPSLPFELYNDALRWAIDKLCRDTDVWEVITTITTVAGQSVYNLDLPVGTVVQANMYIIQKGNVDRRINPPVNNNFSNTPASDYLQSFKTYSKDEIEITTPDNGGVTLEVHSSIRPIKNVTEVQNDAFFDEYADCIISGALSRIYKMPGNNKDLQAANDELQEFKNAVSKIHVEILNKKASTPMKLSAGWW